MVVQINFTNLFLVVFITSLIAFALFMQGGNSRKPCKGQPGEIFTDCINPEWQGISSWEARYDNHTEYVNLHGNNSDLVQWRIVSADDSEHGEVIDVRYSDIPANGRLRFHTARFGDSVDMSAYAGGKVTFDVRVLKWGKSERTLTANFACGYPCNTGPMSLPLAPHNDWQTVTLAVDTLVSKGLDLSKVDIGLAISPPWNGMQGFHFQLDNIRWQKP